MAKKVSSVFAAVVFVILLVFLLVKGAEAFCVHNSSDTPIAVTQTSGHKFLEGYQDPPEPRAKWMLSLVQ